MRLLTARRWNPYAVGIALGVLSWITFAVMHKALGVSTTVASTPGALIGLVAPDHVQQQPYFSQTLNAAKGKSYFDWQFFLVIMLPVGAWIAHRLSGERFRETMPAVWEQRFGPSVTKRYIGAFLGGMILLYGARMAGGCTSGHGISGGLQLALSSWAFFLAMFASGLITAFALFGMKGRQNV